MTVEDIGIVVIGRNEGQRLNDCLRSVVREALPVVYVDSDSTDGSVTAAEQLGAFVVRLDPARPFTAARAQRRVRGTETLRPNIRYVQFIDGDCRLVPGWIETARGFLAPRKGVAVVCGRRRELYPQASVYNWLCDVEWNTPIGQAPACGGDSLMRVEALEAAGGFRSQLIGGEEPELCVRLRERGWEIWRIDAEMTVHDAAIMRFSRWWRRLVRSGCAFADVWWLHRHSRFGIYLRETVRAVFWGGLLPLVIAVGAFINLNILWLALIYPLHVLDRTPAGTGDATVLDVWAVHGAEQVCRVKRRSAAAVEPGAPLNHPADRVQTGWLRSQAARF